ncbi:MAG: alpha/beta-hydrolase family protein [Rhodococcus sp. (in: high G+C Gram-positive bacteria)]|nr:alpha/beta-hydrolase family protein [Rhodococcus sp. (in: high G+C Gram-positive bacteria)]
MITSVTGASGRIGAARSDIEPQPSTGVRLPRVGTSVALTAAMLASSAPALLPRPAVTQALLTGVSMAIALAVAWSARRALGTRRPARLRAQAWTAGVGALISTGAILSNIQWQNRLRVSMGTPSVDWHYAVDVVGGATCVALTLWVIGLAIRRMCTAMGSIRSVVLIGVVGVLSYFVAVPALWSAMSSSFAASNSALDDAVTAPVAVARSGSPNSLVPWRTLGREGRKFTTGGLDPSTVRTYVGLDSAATLDQRVELAVADMERAGAFDRSVVVVAIPTGSGWVDENAVTGAESRFGGDVATVAVQYSNKPSWATFVFAEDDARRSADAVARAVAARAATKSTPPQIVVYGQSLGSVAGSDAYLSLRHTDPRICGAVWAGPPAGAVDTDGATVLANSSDPVVRWSADLLWSPPNTSTTRPDAPTPMWLPFVSFVQTSVDLAAALDVGAGHGHRYGTDQGTSMPRCR